MATRHLHSRLAEAGIALALALCSVAAPAEVYRWKDAHGNVIFSDTPHEGAEQVELKQTTIVPALKPPENNAPSTSGPGGKPAVVAYQSMAIVAPPNDATVRGQQDIGVDVAIEPALQTEAGHTVLLYVDGMPFGEPSAATHFALNNLDRGSHQLAAAVLDQDGRELLRSPTSVFHLHKTTVGDFPTPPPQPPKK